MRSGRFGPVKITVPPYISAGRHRIWARGGRTGRTASAWFTVLADWPSWPQSRFGVNPDSYDSRENVLRAGDVSLLYPAWTFTAGGEFNSSPVVAGGTVFVTPDDNHIDALNAATGAVLSSAAVAIGIAYVGGAATGAKLRSHGIGSLVAFGVGAGGDRHR